MSDICLYDTIAALKQKRNAAILAHYYEPMEIQGIADMVGDSFELAKFAAGAENPVIVICGVRFMAETVKILSPEKTVLLPVRGAGCGMADMVNTDDVKKLRKLYPAAAVMCYVNTSAAVKAECDICCTSSSAVKAAKYLRQKQVVFLPDKNLGAYIRRKVPEKEFILWDGFCPVHDGVTESDLRRAKSEHPDAKVLAHPECIPEIQQSSDFVGSTSGIINNVMSTHEKEYIIGTETGVTERLCEVFPEKSVYPLSNGMVCVNMKKIGLDDIKKSLENNTYEVNVPEKILVRAKASLEKMMEACG